jgi:hypothetical protein
MIGFTIWCELQLVLLPYRTDDVAERTRLTAEDSLSLAQTRANTDIVAIYRALGGGWGTEAGKG